MATSVASLWPTDIQPKAQSPFAILDVQARELTRITNGILVGDVKVTSTDDEQKIVTLDIVVPILDNYRHRILKVTHGSIMIYPARIDADCFHRKPDRKPDLFEMAQLLEGPDKEENEATTDSEFQALVAKVLQSAEVKAIAVSLIARANEVEKERQREAESHAESTPPTT